MRSLGTSLLSFFWPPQPLSHPVNLLVVIWMLLAINGIVYTVMTAVGANRAYRNMLDDRTTDGEMISSRSIRTVSFTMVAVQTVFLVIGAYALVTEQLPLDDLPVVLRGGNVIAVGLVLSSAILNYAAIRTWTERRKLVAYIVDQWRIERAARDLATTTARSHQEAMQELHSIHEDVAAGNKLGEETKEIVQRGVAQGVLDGVPDAPTDESNPE